MSEEYCYRKLLGTALLSTIIVAQAPAGSLAANYEWPRFRGANGSGVAAGHGFPTEFGPKTNLAWRCETPGGSSSPVVSAERTFLTGYAQNPRLRCCFDLKTARRLLERS